MKELKDYITEQILNTNIDEGSHCESYVNILEFNNKMIDMFYPDENCPEDILEHAKDRHIDVVLEMLNSHDWKKLKSALEKEFKDNILSIRKTENKSTSKDSDVAKIQIITNDWDDEKKIKESEKFKTILQFFNYFYSETQDMGRPVMSIEPTFAEKVNVQDELSERNHGIAYHVTKKVYVDKILKKGLKPRQATYRDYPSRIYLISPYKASKEETKKIIHKIVDDKKYLEGEYAVLKVDLSRIHDSFYTDVSTIRSKEVEYQGQAYIYTYQDIPAKFIKDDTENWK